MVRSVRDSVLTDQVISESVEPLSYPVLDPLFKIINPFIYFSLGTPKMLYVTNEYSRKKIFREQWHI